MGQGLGVPVKIIFTFHLGYKKSPWTTVVEERGVYRYSKKIQRIRTVVREQKSGRV